QSYEIRMLDNRKTGELPELNNKMVKSTSSWRAGGGIVLGTVSLTSVKKPAEIRLHSTVLCVICSSNISMFEPDIPMSVGIVEPKTHPSQLNAAEFLWDMNKRTSVFVQVHCISTEFTPRKHGGEKGVPFRIQIDTFTQGEGGEYTEHLHSASCQIKVFKTRLEPIIEDAGDHELKKSSKRTLPADCGDSLAKRGSCSPWPDAAYTSTNQAASPSFTSTPLRSRAEMASFISVPLKKSSEVDLVKPLSKFVTASYPAGEEQSEYLRAVEELNKLRKSALGRPLDKHESSLEILLRQAVSQLSVTLVTVVCMGHFLSRSPFSSGMRHASSQLSCMNTQLSPLKKHFVVYVAALASLGYEKTCVLFNCAALASQIATEQNMDNDECLKAAAKYYQLASGAFSHIKDTVLSALNREPTMDICPETVGTLSTIMLAQAQEVFFLKATSGCRLLRRSLQAVPVQRQPSEGQCRAASEYPCQAEEAFWRGDCSSAAELVKTVASRYDEYVSVKDLTDKINRALTAAKKDNDFIYHDRVPEVKDLEHIGKAALVKATAIAPPLSQKYTDLFEKMVPMAVQQSMGIYGQRKAETVNKLVGMMREATNLCNGYDEGRLHETFRIHLCRASCTIDVLLASLNLPAALEDLSGDSIPQSIAEKSRLIVEQGGLQNIEKLMKDLPELLTRNREILDEVSGNGTASL
ncbi:hypothetical protein XENOCAPTIV_016158, partial [Xenoophorus captivus]